MLYTRLRYFWQGKQLSALSSIAWNACQCRSRLTWFGEPPNPTYSSLNFCFIACRVLDCDAQVSEQPMHARASWLTDWFVPNRLSFSKQRAKHLLPEISQTSSQLMWRRRCYSRYPHGPTSHDTLMQQSFMRDRTGDTFPLGRACSTTMHLVSWEWDLIAGSGSVSHMKVLVCTFQGSAKRLHDGRTEGNRTGVQDVGWKGNSIMLPWLINW